ALGLSRHTIKNYLFRIFDKLGVSSRTELLYLTMSTSQAQVEKTNGEAKNEFAELLEAAEIGDCSAQIRLTEHYGRSNGALADPVSAYVWCLRSEKIAASMRNQIEASKNILRQSLSLQQVAEAERAAADWEPTVKKHQAGSTAQTAMADA